MWASIVYSELHLRGGQSNHGSRCELRSTNRELIPARPTKSPLSYNSYSDLVIDRSQLKLNGLLTLIQSSRLTEAGPWHA